jgi:iron(III) transport system substrate-binding protein
MTELRAGLPILRSLALASLSIGFLTSACSTVSETAGQVVVYSSVDEVFARPIAERFQAETGIQVQLVPDTEETKSTGLLNRLIAEKARPQADVFWSGDPVRAAILKSKGVSEAYFSPQAQGLPALYSDPEGHWAAFSARARVLIYNKDLVPAGQAPQSVMDLLDPRFKGRACIANPLFGTTSMHAAALFQVLGEEKARQFFEGFVENGGTIVSSNGEVRRRVAAGDFALGVTDTDDFNVAFQEGKPVDGVYSDAGGIGTLIVPNAAVLIRGGPNPDRGRQFIDYLLQPATEQVLAEGEAGQMPLRSGIKTPPHVRPLETITAMKVDYGKLADLLEQLSAGFLKEWVEANSP